MASHRLSSTPADNAGQGRARTGGWLVTINCGGTLFTTNEHTLELCEPGSMLACLAQLAMSTTASSGALDPQGNLFIDRNPKLFAHVLDYVRNDGQCAVPADLGLQQALLLEARYFGLKGMEAQLLEAQQAEAARREEEASSRARVSKTLREICSKLDALGDDLAEPLTHIRQQLEGMQEDLGELKMVC